MRYTQSNEYDAELYITLSRPLSLSTASVRTNTYVSASASGWSPLLRRVCVISVLKPKKVSLKRFAGRGRLARKWARSAKIGCVRNVKTCATAARLRAGRPRSQQITL